MKNDIKIDKIEIEIENINKKVKLSGEELHKKYREFVKQYGQDKGLLYIGNLRKK